MATIRGRVVDPKGRPVADAAVYIVSAPAHFPDIAQLTDHTGQFAISAPVSGHYSIGARSDDWGTAQADVEIVKGGPTTVDVQVHFTEGNSREDVPPRT